MYNTIVVGTDGSPNALDALRVAAKIGGRSSRSTVHVVVTYRPVS